MKEAITLENIDLCYIPIGYKPTLFHKSKGSKRYTALEHISFSVDEGEVLGIVGTNGSGKSTLLRIIAGILKPDSGSINLHDKTATLLSLGLGFNNSLSGRDNIYLSGLLSGFTKKQISNRIERIVDFSELGDAIDNPIGTYSNGMRSRLSFSTAVEFQTDILLLDEILAVGDIGFKEKCMKKMKEIISEQNRTVIIVSHNMNTIKKICDRVMWLESGHIKMIGNTDDVLTQYQNAKKSL